ncbi:hypothetical protein HRR93_009478 [Exophiala dermatitidis]|nr:hypothetical protein HRR73_009482 [Exophiala dermatitidis]KAJ4531618.1 hypothetical protein HRR77_009367 [Exophiala dermatitidis]KAJ4553987.1 hypothetical protein HRR79_009563 [Exophiala dermatitidis]KAJ4662344.1 hypothetical protein HRR93_009478 [Exophiala dermatitidis]KAJ4689905.1 hypothetical protein HRR87_009073 [Exophiala dermatitidis]
MKPPKFCNVNFVATARPRWETGGTANTWSTLILHHCATLTDKINGSGCRPKVNPADTAGQTAQYRKPSITVSQHNTNGVKLTHVLPKAALVYSAAVVLVSEEYGVKK